MNVNPAAMFKIYKANSINSCQSENSIKTDSAAVKAGTQAEKTDRISISQKCSNQRGVDKVVKNVMSDITKADNSARIEEIKKAIENNTYYVSSGDLADAILARVFGE